MDTKEYNELKVKVYNEQLGELGYYNCSICKNKGHIAYVVDDRYVKMKDCECKKIRKIYKTLETCGITKSMFDNYSLDNYKTTEKFQQYIKDKAISFIEESKEGHIKWFFFGGISKTHICTSIFKSLVDSGKECKYMLWKDEITRLKSMKKSYYEEVQDKFEVLMNEYKAVEVLYIDDFLKLYDDRGKEDLDIAYEIINARYNNSDKCITIISTEFDRAELEKIDMATCGRIYEKSKGYFLQPEKNADRNYRFAGKE